MRIERFVIKNTKKKIAAVWSCQIRYEGCWLFRKCARDAHTWKKTMVQTKKNMKKVVDENLEKLGIVEKMVYDRKL